MHEAHQFLQTLAVVLCTAAVSTVIFQRFRQPVVLGYLLAGMLVGPHVPVPIDSQSDIIHNLAELGVILLMFSLGIEFSLSKLIHVAPTAGFIVIVQCSFMLWLGYLLGQVFGWSTLVSVYAGAIIAFSSTTIVAKAFEEQQIKGEFTHTVFGILIVEDLVAILLIAVLTTVSIGQELGPSELLQTAGRLTAFLAALVIVGLLLVPRLIRAVVRLNRPETTVVASVGLAFGFALMAAALNYSAALGAFIAGGLVAESGVENRVQLLVTPVRDIFAAIFFVSVGMLIDPAQIVHQWPVVSAFTIAVLTGMIGSVSIGAFLTGESIQGSLKTGMSLAQIGEFSFIIAGVGMATDATEKGLYSVAVAVSGITTLLTPWLIHAAGPTAAWVDRKLPRSLQTFAALYGSWIESLGAGADEQRNRVRALLRWLLVDALVITAIVIGASVEMQRISSWAHTYLQLADRWTKLAVIASAAAICAPFAIALIRIARFFGFELACRAFPAATSEQVDLAAAPRRLLVVTLQLAIVLAVGVPLVAITQPFLPPLRGAAFLLFILLILAIPFWRGATKLQGHARAAAQALAEAISRQTRKGRAEWAFQRGDDLDRILTGLGSPVSVDLPSGSVAVGKTLAEIKLRGLTGATVLAIRRGDESVLVPSGHERLIAGDVLAIAGTQEAIKAAKELLAASN
jgi:CPA2 family monovalent cation:H+ antiporter-2